MERNPMNYVDLIRADLEFSRAVRVLTTGGSCDGSLSAAYDRYQKLLVEEAVRGHRIELESQTK